jgi:hypothetical protein
LVKEHPATQISIRKLKTTNLVVKSNRRCCNVIDRCMISIFALRHINRTNNMKSC